MTRTHHDLHDLFATQHLETVGQVTSSCKIFSETHDVDILFVPHAKVQENLTALGILGQAVIKLRSQKPLVNCVLS
ncbi:MAG: hypothetical protein HC934_12105 [Acaryochloridaceae cyanobacterium SU_2_1]|nr:hypothetical protein [Acaryochloridaceae cyanobacterium SU_2_1]